MSLTAGTFFSVALLAKCSPGPYYNYENLTLTQTEVAQGELPVELRSDYAELLLEGDEHGFAIGLSPYFRVGEREAEPNTAQKLERTEQRNRGRACRRRIPVQFVAIWPGSFRTETGFAPATMQIEPTRERATLTLEAEDGPIVLHYNVTATSAAAGCSVRPDAPARAPGAGLLLIFGLCLARRRARSRVGPGRNLPR